MLAVPYGMRIVALALLLCLPHVCPAQGESSPSSRVSEDVLLSLRGIGRYLSSPLRADGVDWLAAGGTAAATGGMMLFDGKIRDGFGLPGRNDMNGDLWDVPTLYGDVIGATGVGVVLYGIGLAGGDAEIRTTGRMALQALASGAIAAYSLRFITGRSRPFTGDGPGRFQWFEPSHAQQSFPSGHTTAAFALSTVLAERIGTVWSRVGFYSLAAWTGLSRVRNDRHWASDVVLGAAIGFSAGMAAVGGEGREQEEGGGFELLPAGAGVTLLYRLP